MVKKHAFIHNAVISEMVDSSGIKRTAPSDDAMYLIAFFEEQFCQIGTILAGNAGYECFFHEQVHIPYLFLYTETSSKLYNVN